MPEVIGNFRNALLASDKDAAIDILDKYLLKHTPLDFVEAVAVKALDEIGTGWEKGEYALSQVYMSGRICEEMIDRVLPDQSGQRIDKPKMAIALLNDYHSLGKKTVYSVLRAGGFQLIDYGRMETEDLINRVLEDRLELILISALMLSSALQVKEVVRKLNHGSEKVKIVVGGAPFRLDRQLWQAVGADAVGYTASDALKIVSSLQGGKTNE